MTATLQQTRYAMRENPIAFAAFALFLVFLLVGVLGDAIAPYDPLASNAAIALQPPSWQ
ncbi:MAG: ABC transporter permease, partial [Cyanobacteria bacterium J06642_2]